MVKKRNLKKSFHIYTIIEQTQQNVRNIKKEKRMKKVKKEYSK